MKYCSKCGKELFDEAVICVGCGCPVGNTAVNNVVESKPKQEVYTESKYLEENASQVKIFTFIAIGLGVLSLAIYLFVHIWIGALILVPAIVLLSLPQTAIRKEYNKNCSNKGGFKKYFKDLKGKFSALKLNAIIVIVIGVLLITFGVGIGVIDAESSSIPYDLKHLYYGYESDGFITQLDVLDNINNYANSDIYNYSR